MEALNGGALRSAFAHIPSGVVAICAEAKGTRIGMAASTFVPVSLDPPLVAFCVQNTSTTWPRLAGLPHLGISVLSDAHGGVVGVLAAKVGDRFAGVETETRSGGAVLVREAVVGMDVTVAQQVPAGDHLIVILHINEVCQPDQSGSILEPIVFHRSGFRQLMKT